MAELRSEPEIHRAGPVHRASATEAHLSLALALAAGNEVLVKTSAKTPLSACRFVGTVLSSMRARASAPAC
ncbi:hypothetical protein [Amycolatopsis magusensis]|uniref:hypothetical protein n=1 Tax=Amycolatopsis magusensis TaxID=882444 RepID=UPI0024A8783E|nr:hypothetical protein [Amycolatopsis magusensis]MDI5976777.1 hypothetical protein [Amycolatopsis magusensis]